MLKLLCATTNEQKFGIAKHILASFNIDVERVSLEIDEIQGEDSTAIIRDKAQKAYKKVRKPVIVTDDSWSIPALGGFPGPYMKSINHWFTPEDFINLMQHKTDRTIFLHQYVAYHDSTSVHIFTNDIPGKVVPEPRGSFGPPIMHVAALQGDNGLTISEAYDRSNQHNEARLANPDDAWRQLGEWLKVHA